MAASEQQSDPGEVPGDVSQSLRRYWAPRYWPTWLFVGWLKLTALLPWRLAILIHKGVGRTLWYLLPRARRVVLRNLEICFPDLSPAATTALARRYFANLGASIAEIALAWFGTAPWTQPPVRIEGLEHLRMALARGKGVILFCGHFTTMELANQPLKKAIPLFAFMYRQRNNPVLDEMQTRGRQRTGHVSVANTSTRAMLRLLRQNAAVWYAPDQAYVGKSSVLLPFFGEPAMTTTATSRLARASGAPLLPLHFRRLDGGAGYLLRVEPPLDSFPSDDAVDDTRRLNEVLEGLIRECPEQYFWTHRKFKNRGEGLPDVYQARPKKPRGRDPVRSGQPHG